MLSCERQVNKLRREFLKAILRQEIAWFDENQSGELTSRLSELVAGVFFKKLS